MGDLNDDLLNYEADLLEDEILNEKLDEDELLLSDEEINNADARSLSDSEAWVSKTVEPTNDNSNERTASDDVTGSNDVSPTKLESNSEKRRISTPDRTSSHRALDDVPSGSTERTTNDTVSSTPETPILSTQVSGISDAVDSTWINTPESTPSSVKDQEVFNKNNEVSSTYEEEKSPPEESKCVSSTIDSTPSRTDTDESQVVPSQDTPTTESSDVVSSLNDTPYSTTTPTTDGREAETTEDDERTERVNPKTSVEKLPPPEEQFKETFDHNKHRRENQPPHHPTLGGVTPLYPPRHEFPYGPPRPGFNNTRPGFPMRLPYYMQRPQFGPGMRPGMVRPDMRGAFVDPRTRAPMPGGPAMFRGPMRPPGPFPATGPAAPFSGGPNAPLPVQVPQVAPMPRKVLINPNFKGGGIEAAKSQLLKDTQQFIAGTNRPLTDDELLRQQEEFITRNLIQVEKRRHEVSPTRKRSRSRSRTRSRSFTPPRKRRSRERERRPFNNKRPWRRNDQDWNKRRKSLDRDDVNEDEDEETREYRRKVAEQKALREKLLRDKERRRKEAAEEQKRLLMAAETKRKADEAARKCTPVVVTNKIISLKGIKSSSDSEEKKSSQDSGVATERVKKTDEDSKTTAVVKPLPKVVKPLIDDIDEKLEAELLEEEPMTPPTPPPPIKTNRRVVLKNVASQETATTTSGKDGTMDGKSQKRVFDRLDRKTNAAGTDSTTTKRKIQRTVTN